MKYLGIFLVIAGLIIAAGYGIFLLGKGFFSNPDIGIPVRIAVPAIVLGLIFWVTAVIREKFQEASQRETPVIMDRDIHEMDERELGRGGRR